MPFTFTSTGGSGEGTPGKDSLFLGTWNSVTEFLAVYQGGPVGLADGDWWAFVKDNTDPNKVYVVREDPNSATGWVIDDNEHFVLPAGADGADGADGERGISALSWTYKAQTGVVNVDPGNDYLNFNADPFTSSTQIRVDDNPYGLNTTLHDLFLNIQSGYLSVTSQSDPSSYATFEIVSCVDGTATNETLDGSYVIFNVSLVSTYGAISNEDFVTLSLAPAGQQGEPGTPGTPGADALWDYLGEYNGGTTYSAGAVVTYDGQLWYRNVYTSAGYVPGVNNSYWDLLAAKGNNGTSFTSRGAWTDSENYAINDIVTFEGSAYVCIVGVTAGTDVAPYPQHIGAYWNLLISGSTVDTGQITFLGVYIIGAGGGSGDGAGNGTIKLMPDENLVQQPYHEDQYLIIDPTSPNHIHIRAGGVQDASTADLFLGAERNNVIVSDGYNNVKITSTPDSIVNTYGNSNSTSNTQFIHATGANIQVGDTVRLYTGGDTFTVTSVAENEGAMTVVAYGLTFIPGEAYTFTREQSPNTWRFEEDGVLYGPAMGGIKALGLLNSGNSNLELFANDANIVLQAPSGSVDISAPEININSISVPSSLNINTYLGAIVNSNRTSAYADEDKVVATLGDLPTGATGTFTSQDNKTVTVTNGIITSIV